MVKAAAPIQMRGKGGAGPMHQNNSIEISTVSQARPVRLPFRPDYSSILV